jgi:metal-responsive CopG/Arc/MetJ family transcriptional regulator
MPRTIVDLPTSQLKDLDSRCRALGISRAEGVRRAIQGFLSESTGDGERGFGLWKSGGATNKNRRAADEDET